MFKVGKNEIHSYLCSVLSVVMFVLWQMKMMKQKDAHKNNR